MWMLNFKMIADAVKGVSKTITVLSEDIRELTEEVKKMNGGRP